MKQELAVGGRGIEGVAEGNKIYLLVLEDRTNMMRVRSRLPIIRYVEGKPEGVPVKSLPEPNTVLDESNANYSSTVVTESTPISLFKHLQGKLRPTYRDLIKKAMPNFSDEKFRISFPEVDLRNFDKRAHPATTQRSCWRRSTRGLTEFPRTFTGRVSRASTTCPANCRSGTETWS